MKKENSETLLAYGKILKENGFDVYIPIGENPTYFNFVKDNNIGYVEMTNSGFNFSTVHKPNIRCGTGYSIGRDVLEPTIKSALECFKISPHWASDNDKPIKYKSWEDYIKSPINTIVEKIKL